MKSQPIIISFVFLFLLVNVYSQGLEVYPSNWWVGMKKNEIQIMVYEKNKNNKIAHKDLVISSNAKDVEILKIHKVENERYLFVDIKISPNAKPQNLTFELTRKYKKWVRSFNLELLPRRKGNGTQFAQGIIPKDLIYLIMPDRFCNGNYSNDRVAGMKDQSLNRDTIYERHGGDIQGVTKRLDYLKDLGVTAVWLTPVIENDMPNRTEHGYAFTNHYRIDPRLGGEKAYETLSDELHKRGMKLVQDGVYNHVGIYHFTVQDPPMKSWLHQWDEFTKTNYKDQALFDIYHSKKDKKIMEDGWFSKQMPDMNHDNQYVENYLIQHAIWLVERFGVDGWRVDTYPYNDLEFMNKCNQALYSEYPNLTIFGETWVYGVINQSYFCENNLNIPVRSNLKNTTDFQMLFYGIEPSLKEDFGWTNGVNKLYTTACKDVVYKHPMTQVIFLDNHDLPRFFSVVKEDTAKYKMALAWLLTYRGIPQLYYGDEICMTGFTNPDGNVRHDFKGGWKEDKVNKFTSSGRTKKEESIFNYIKTLANFRKSSSAITKGKFMHYIPYEGVYVYFRYDEKQTIMCVMNTGSEEKTINTQRFKERVKNHTKAYNIVTGVTFDISKEIKIGPNYLLIMELK